MNDQEDDLDLKVREYLSAKLDAQRGRAGRAFGEMIRHHRRRQRWIIAGASGLVAASVAVAAWVNWPVRAPSRRIVAEETSAPRNVEQLTAWRARDDGTMVLDNRIPVRRVRSEAVEEVKWFDPQTNSTLRLTIPREQVILVKQDIY